MDNPLTCWGKAPRRWQLQSCGLRLVGCRLQQVQVRVRCLIWQCLRLLLLLLLLLLRCIWY